MSLAISNKELTVCAPLTIHGFSTVTCVAPFCGTALIIVADDRNAVVHKPKMAGEIAARGFCDIAADFSLTQKRPHIHKQRKFAVGILVKIDQIDACGDADDSTNIADIRMDDALRVSPAAKQQQRRLSPVSAARRRAQPSQIDRGEMLERQKIFPRLPEIFTQLLGFLVRLVA